ncbi:septal ring lytic transglycosylase RlpA family protein [Stutzerimonas tarimensis]|uniref:Endolytic peptidoglycan transglycosylase RlpA n=1 Tax=Stutzerimonas tarimensis TaxID=1507735 RepID=A0ABV7SZL1_9GAMM
MHPPRGLPLVLLLLFALLAGCASKGPSGYSQTGQASFYGARHHGNQTANGERFNQRAMTAAHRSLPFGSKVRVTNLDNGKQVTVRINDRGPFVRGRIIDLSRGAFARIADTRQGIVPVKIEVIR